MQEEEKEGFTFSELIRIISIYKWLALIIACVITIGGTLGIYYGYNNSKLEYSVRFSLNMPFEIDGTKYTYPDGKTFYYTDIVLRSTLSEVKESNEDFENININAMSANWDINISRNLEQVGDVNEFIYTLKVKANYFKSKAQAKEFMVELINSPSVYISNMKMEYDDYLKLCAVCEDYETEIDSLQQQIDYLINEYEKLILTYGGNFVVSGKSLNSYFNELSVYNDKHNIEMLLAQARNGRYLKNETSKDKYRLYKSQLERQLEIAQATLDNMLKTSGEAQGGVSLIDATAVKQQSDLVGKLKQQISDYTNYIEEGVVNTEFGAVSVNKEYGIVKSFTDTFTAVVSSVYEKATSVIFFSSNAIEVTDGVGVVNAVLISLLIGIIAALLVAYIAGYSKMKKLRKAENAYSAEQNEESTADKNSSTENIENKE